jgi:hypothetical protein
MKFWKIAKQDNFLQGPRGTMALLRSSVITLDRLWQLKCCWVCASKDRVNFLRWPDENDFGHLPSTLLFISISPDNRPAKQVRTVTVHEPTFNEQGA